MIYLFMLSRLEVGWFNLYYNNLLFSEIIVYTVILALFSKATLKGGLSK